MSEEEKEMEIGCFQVGLVQTRGELARAEDDRCALAG
jgi:hypothetical protein